MLNSRDTSLLRDDVERNCRTFITLCKEKGLSVLVTTTVRDDEYQLLCYKNGKSKSKVPTFHSVKAGLAFDYCQNIKGREYEAAFYAATAPLAKKMGFTWGGDWKAIVDKPHLQWDDHGAYSGTDILRGNYPPEMPTCESEDNMTKNEAKVIVKEKTGLSNETISYIADYYAYGEKTIIKLAEAMK